MRETAQRKAIKTYRARLAQKGVARFEVTAPAPDRPLIRALAKRLVEDGPEAAEVRRIVSQAVSGEPPRRGGILAALRSSPLVGAELDLRRDREEGRQVDL